MKHATVVLASSLLFATAARAADPGPASRGKILVVASNPAVSKQTGWPIGLWAAELTHPYLEFTNAGYEVDVVSPDGGALAFDAYSDPEHESGYSAGDLISLGFKHSKKHMAMLENSRKLSDVKLDDYRAVFVVGGQGPMYTFRGNKAVQDAVVKFHAAKKPTALVCHGTTVLLEAKLPNGKLLVDGKRWTGFANSEEDIADKAVGQKIQPYRIEDEARKLKGTTFVVKPAFSSHAIADGNLVTGQQQNSGVEAARLVIAMLEKAK
ncbi:MAG: type 1 glutamine amidotransferase domain-containing protein [Myxococcaceae bacterium]|nr:type 1 glutamine amidotransferase domain-containing protein [Myxococcaceae bacterium]MCA3012193.1 type 1 glutamine amidotransferase domain-containing protein [Myxococcaceae bacterium]